MYAQPVINGVLKCVQTDVKGEAKTTLQYDLFLCLVKIPKVFQPKMSKNPTCPE